MGGTPRGVEIHRGKLRVHFRYAGKLRREPLGLPATRANIQHAGRLANEIREKIRHGIFDYAEYFPDRAPSAHTVRHYTATYLQMQSHLADSTVRGYRQTLRTVLDDRLGDMPISHVTASMLGQTLEEHGWQSAKARNNALTPIRGVFDLALQDRVIRDNPAALLKSAKVQSPEPDPLTIEEADAVLAWMAEHKAPQTHNYFEFALFSGLRTSELLALAWTDIDRRAGVLRVQRARVLGNMKTTKTARSRDVELSSRALRALERQRQHTHLKTDTVFLDPITDRPYVNDKPPRLHWNAALKALGIRHRTAYQTRHTYATLALMAGANPMWVARQLGHSTMQITLTRYSRWLDRADHRREVNKLDQAIGGGEHLGNNPGNTGRF